MTFRRVLRWASAVVVLVTPGCTALREIPRGEYAAVPERQNIRLVTREGLEYEFDFARFGPDSMTGFRRRDVQGVVEEFASLQVDYREVAKLSARRVDWYRTMLIGGGVLAAVAAAGLSTSSGGDGGGDGGSGGGGRPPPIN